MIFGILRACTRSIHALLADNLARPSSLPLPATWFRSDPSDWSRLGYDLDQDPPAVEAGLVKKARVERRGAPHRGRPRIRALPGIAPDCQEQARQHRWLRGFWAATQVRQLIATDGRRHGREHRLGLRWSRPEGHLLELILLPGNSSFRRKSKSTRRRASVLRLLHRPRHATTSTAPSIGGKVLIFIGESPDPGRPGPRYLARQSEFIASHLRQPPTRVSILWHPLFTALAGCHQAANRRS